jgi:hypothetical protein
MFADPRLMLQQEILELQLDCFLSLLFWDSFAILPYYSDTIYLICYPSVGVVSLCESIFNFNFFK